MAFDTLIDDIYNVLSGVKLPDPIVDDITSNAEFAKRVIEHIHADLVPADRSDRDPNEVYVTQLSHPCTRKGWYERYATVTAKRETRIQGHGKFKFLYGDLIEESFLYLAKAAGHTVLSTQSRFVRPIPNGLGLIMAGRIDAVIDGWLVDVKSCDPYTFDKVVKGEYDDKFGYGTQLRTYAWLMNYDVAGIANIFINKVNGKMHIYNQSFLLEKTQRDYFENVQLPLFGAKFQSSTIPEKHPDAVESDGMLGITCSYCPFKFECFPELRVYSYASGPKFLTDTRMKTVKVPDITDAYKTQMLVC